MGRVLSSPLLFLSPPADPQMLLQESLHISLLDMLSFGRGVPEGQKKNGKPLVLSSFLNFLM